MAQHRIFTATELVPLLRDRGIDLSASQVHRMVSCTPERLLQVLSAFCDIFSCTPADLMATAAENAGVRKAATGDLPAPTATDPAAAPPGSHPARCRRTDLRAEPGTSNRAESSGVSAGDTVLQLEACTVIGDLHGAGAAVGAGRGAVA